ncbi:MAG: hypothetical protein AB1644_08655 [Candidatus Zixiibacteriota bacterium]
MVRSLWRLIVAMVGLLVLGVTASAQSYLSTWNTYGGGTNGSVMALTVFEGDLIAGGAFTVAGDVACRSVARWNGSNWQPIGLGLHASVEDFAVYNGQLIAACEPSIYQGEYVDTVTFLARWDGANWIDLGFGSGQDFNCLLVWGTKLVVGGHFDSVAGVPTNGVAMWDGVSWQPLGTGLDGRVMALADYNGDLIAAGWFKTNGNGDTVNYVARWDGASWQPMGAGFAWWSECLGIHNGQLVAGGHIRLGPDHTNGTVMVWNGSDWEVFGGLLDEHEIPVSGVIQRGAGHRD